MTGTEPSMSPIQYRCLKIKGARKRGRGLPNNRLARRRRCPAACGRAAICQNDSPNCAHRHFERRRNGAVDTCHQRLAMMIWRRFSASAERCTDEVLVYPLPWRSKTIRRARRWKHFEDEAPFLRAARGAGRRSFPCTCSDVDKKMDCLMSSPCGLISAWK